MANLDNTHHIKSTKTLDFPVTNQVIMVWDLELTSEEDTVSVPALDSSLSAVSLTAGISVDAGGMTPEGNNVITVNGGSPGEGAILVTAHKKGRLNSISTKQSEIDHIVLLGDSYLSLSDTYWDDLVAQGLFDVTLDSTSLVRPGDGMGDFLEIEDEIRAVLASYPTNETVALVVNTGGFEALNEFSAAVMTARSTALLDIFLDYPNVEVLWQSYQEYPVPVVDARFNKFYAVLPPGNLSPRYEFVDFRGKIANVEYADALHLVGPNYVDRTSWIWDKWLTPRMRPVT